MRLNRNGNLKPLLIIKETKLERADFVCPSAVNVCNRRKGGSYVYSFLSLHFLSAVVPTILS